MPGNKARELLTELMNPTLTIGEQQAILKQTLELLAREEGRNVFTFLAEFEDGTRQLGHDIFRAQDTGWLTLPDKKIKSLSFVTPWGVSCVKGYAAYNFHVESFVGIHGGHERVAALEILALSRDGQIDCYRLELVPRKIRLDRPPQMSGWREGIS